MLDLVHAFAPGSSSHLQFLFLPNETLLAYPSADTVVLLNARTLSFVRALAIWEVFPGVRESKARVGCVSTDSAMCLIAASLGVRVAVWSLSGVQKDVWRVHSSLALSEGHPVTALDCKSGLLAVGSSYGLSVFTLSLENDLPTWSRKWSIKTHEPFGIRFSPSLTHISTASSHDNAVHIFSTAAGRQTQVIRHPRSINEVFWRFSRTSSRDDLILYTITADATLRIFLPVLDDPQRLQLHASLDLFSSTSLENYTDKFDHRSNIFWLDRNTIAHALTGILAQNSGRQEQDSRYRRIEEMNDEGWDFFMRVLLDGSLVLKAVANIDRRPPTLLKQFSVLHFTSSAISSLPSHLSLLPTPDLSSLTLVTCPPLTSHELDPLTFFDSQQSGLKVLAKGTDANEKESKIQRFVRTPEGKGIGVIKEDCVESWLVSSNGTNLRCTGCWSAVDHVVILDGGKRTGLYCESSRTLTLQPSSPTVSLPLPHLISLFSLPSTKSYTSIIGVTPDLCIVHVRLSNISIAPPELFVYSESTLPLDKPLKMILAVDPMAWSDRSRDDGPHHDVLLSVADDGELAFWVPGEGKAEAWVCTGRVRTGRSGFSMARCSSAKKSALVIPGDNGEELTIWDSKESEFASGLEYLHVFDASEPINDLDWTSTPDQQSILAVGFAHHVIILCQQRMTYFDREPAWRMSGRIEIGHMTPYSISDSIWMAGGSLLVAAGYHMFQFGRALSSAEADDGSRPEHLFEHVARLNGPLEDYHPQMILQCLLWGKVELVKEIIVNLARDLEEASAKGARMIDKWRSIPVQRFLTAEQPITMRTNKPRYSLFLEHEETVDSSDDGGGFSRQLVQRLIEQLETEPLSHLTRNEHAHLVVLIQTTLEIEEQRRALDANGLRYLISMRSFYILNGRASTPGTLAETEATAGQLGRRERLRFRDMVWAFHSESQEILLSASTAACGGKMTWPDARALGIYLWLNSVETMKAHMETIARNHYMAGDLRDPTACCLYYFALGKVKLVHGLWKQAAWHKEQSIMLKFLSNDFSQPRWRTAALKNAYALLGKQRFEYAAAFFLLGGRLKDATSVCIRQMEDFQLGIALARVIEQGDDGPVLHDILKSVVIPLAFQKGNRWLGSWAFWLLRRRDLAVRILVTPLDDITRSLDVRVTEIGDPNYDDPSLALLFSQLKSKTLQTAKGTSEISSRMEFKFVLQTARVFCRMGCHVLALDLVKSWSFDRPTSILRNSSTKPSPASKTSPVSPQFRSRFATRPGFALSPHIRRRSSIMIDMEVPSDPSTRAASPELTTVTASAPVNEIQQADGDLPTRQAGLGSLMKSAKLDVTVPDFDMNAFF